MSDDLLDEKKVGEFWDKCYELAGKTFELDCDGDLPVQVKVLDRTRFQPSHYLPIPYDHKAASIKELNEIGDRLTKNVQIAIEALQSYYQCREYEEKRINVEIQRKKNP